MNISENLPYKDATNPVSVRVGDLLERMTLDEKIAQMHGFWMVLSEDGEHRFRDGDAFLDGGDSSQLKRLLEKGLGQVTRAMGTHGVGALAGLRALNRLQRYLLKETRLGIPAMSHEECLTGLMTRDGTLFPSALSYSATWNPELIQQVGEQIGAECRAIGCHQGLAPVLDVSRDVRWGRTEETFGEDPYLVGVLATRYVRGLQGPKRDVLATLKHYAGHSFGEGARNHAPVNLGWRELNDTFLLPFEMVVKLANAGSVMPAYHDIDGEPAHASARLLTEVLRNQWGFDGLVVADYAGVNLLYKDHGVAIDAAQSAAMAFNAGLDVELPNDDCVKHLGLALERGQVSIEKVDEIVARILTTKFRLGLFECTFEDPASVTLRTQATRDVALEVARQSIVVLENNGILPLAAATKQRLAVIGPCAADPMAQLSGYSFPVHVILQGANEGASHVKTPLQGLHDLFTQAQISYVQGCELLVARTAGAPVFPGDVRDVAGERAKSPICIGTEGMAEAVQNAKDADIAIVCVGDLAGLFQTGTVGEGSDTDSLRLPGVQQQLLESIVGTGTPTIVVMSGGRPYNLGGLEDKVAAFLMTFTGGQMAGQAIAEVLAGVTQPSGRMTISVPTSAGATPYFYNHKLKSAGAPIAFHFGSRYPFGCGMSYTTFAYKNLCMETPRVDLLNGDVILTLEIANVGERAATEVVQVYVRDRHASVVRPLKELKAFQRVYVAPNMSRTLRITLPVDMLCLTDHSGKRVVEPGWFDLMIGASSANILLRSEFEVVGNTSRTLPRDWRMESCCEIL